MKKAALFLAITLFFNVNNSYSQEDTLQQHYISSLRKISSPSKTLDGISPRASWIWDHGDPNPTNYHLLVRKEISIPEEPLSAPFYISAYSYSDVYINGILLDRCPMNCDPEFQVYEKYDIHKYLRRGKNIISAEVYNFGIGMHHRINARAGFFLQGEIEFKSAPAIKVNSDKSWKVEHALAWENSNKLRTGSDEDSPHLIGFNEKFNSSLMPEGWMNTNFNDLKWDFAYEIGIPPVAPWNNIVVVERPPLLRQEFFPVKKWKVKDKMIYDMGKEYSAYPHIKVKALKAGQILEIGTGERLLTDSSVNSTKRVNYTDQFITRSGTQSWSSSTWRSFRYISVEEKDSLKEEGSLTIEGVSAQARRYDLKEEGSFECSDTLLNKIYKTGTYTLQLCAQDTYMDTPWREQTQYIGGDSRFVQKYNLYCFGNSAKLLSDYNILSGAQSQRWNNDGAIRSRYPTDWLLGENTSAYLIDYELEWIIMLGEHFLYNGDKELIRQVYPNMVKLLNYIKGFAGKDHGLLKDTPGWIVLDHPQNYPIEKTNEITALNCLYYEALRQASFLARFAIYDEENQKKWDKESEELKANIRKWLWDPENRLFRDCFGSKKHCQQTQVYAL
ncbi:MAG: family 78 glycoside hydrolase catalytic domain, partial [Clostridiales bacterium]